MRCAFFAHFFYLQYEKKEKCGLFATYFNLSTVHISVSVWGEGVFVFVDVCVCVCVCAYMYVYVLMFFSVQPDKLTDRED